MSVTLKIKRRAASGNAGAPTALQSGELAFNENTSTDSLFYGYGDDGSGNATSVITVAGAGSYVTRSTAQSISGNKTFTGTVALGSATLTGVDTDSVAEASNLYFTTARARQSVSVTDAGGDGSLSYDNSTGVITYTGASATETRAHFSVTDNGGDGALSYDNSTGVISYTGPSPTEARAHFSVTDTGGDGSLAYNSSTGVITYTGPSAAEARAHLSASTSTGAQYDAATGIISLSGIPNSAITNNSVTVNSTTVALGAAITLNTDDVGEGSSNEYFTTARARASISATGGASYNSTSGVISVANIANSELTNSTITVSDGSTSTAIALGQTVAFNGTANEVTVGESSGTLTIGLPDDVQITNDLTIGGDLTVNGSVTSVNSTTITVDDKNLELGSIASPTDSTADGGGITLLGATNKIIQWLASTSSWTFNQAINITAGGLKIGGTQIIDNSRVVTNLAITGAGNTIDNVVLDGGVF